MFVVVVLQLLHATGQLGSIHTARSELYIIMLGGAYFSQ